MCDLEIFAIVVFMKWVVLFLCLLLAEISAADWSLGGQFLSFEYDEWEDGAHIMEETGLFPGIYIQTSRRIKGTDQLRIQWVNGADIGFSTIQYKSTYGHEAPVTTTGDDKIIRLWTMLELEQTINVGYILFKTGVGIRYWEDNLKGVGEKMGYLRKTTHYYLPIHLGYGIQLWDRAAGIEVIGIYNVFLSGNNQAIGFIANGSVGDFLMRQHTGYGVGIKVCVYQDIAKNYRLMGDIQIHRWSLDKSDKDRGVFEPKNKTITYELKVGVLWRFGSI